MTYRFRHDESVTDGLRRIAAETSFELLQDLSDPNHALAQRVHDARKRIKRLRALVRLARPGLGERFKGIDHDFRMASRVLAPVREPRARLETFDAHCARADDSGRLAESLGSVRAHLVDAAEAAEGGGAAETAIAAASAKIARLAASTTDWRFEESGFSALRGGLARTYAAGRRAMRNALADAQPEEVHRWRRRAKEHAHQLALLRPVWRRALGAERHAAKALVDALGESRDAGLLADQLEVLAQDLPQVELTALVGELRDERARRLAAAFRVGPLVYTEKPGAHVRRIHGYWRAWRRGPTDDPHGEHPAARQAEHSEEPSDAPTEAPTEAQHGP